MTVKHLIEQLESLTEANLGSDPKALSEEFGGLRGVRNWDWNNLPKNEVDPDEDGRFMTVASLLLLKTKTPGVVKLLAKPYGKAGWSGKEWGDLRDIEKLVKKSLEFRLKQEAVMVRDNLNEAIADGFMEDWQLRDAMKDIYRALESVRREIKGVRASMREGREPVIVVSAPRLNEQAAKYEDTRMDVFNKAIGYP